MGDLIRINRGDGTTIAARIRDGLGPALLFLPGYASDMSGGKATALDRWAAEHGRAFARFDYAGTGESDGDFEAQTLDGWLGDALLLLDRLATRELVLIGSSMGGWLALLAALARPTRVRGIVGIAAAPDFSDWGYSDDEKRMIREAGRLVQPSDHGDAMVTTRTFLESADAHRLLDGPIAIDCPVRLLHGAADRDVPVAIAHRIADRLRSADVQTIIVKDGDHRLSRAQDIDLMLRTVAALVEPE